MTDDEILKVAGEIERGRDVLVDPRWQALAEGTLGEADRAELEALASRSEEARRALEAHRPLDAAEQAEIVERLLAASPTPAIAPVIALRPHRKVRAAIVALGSLAAAAALFLMLPAREPGAIPAYEVAMAGEQAQRGPAPLAGAPRVFGPGSDVELVLRPAVAEKGPIAARGFLSREGRAQAWAPPIEVSSDGAVRIAGPYEAVFRGVAPGAVELVIVVGRPGAIPSDATLVEMTRQGSSSGPREGSWHLLRVPVRLLDRSSPRDP